MDKYWYALRVKPHKERPISQRLLEDEVEHYLPLVRVEPKNQRNAKQKPYFPGYLFIYADLEELGSNKFRWLPGALGLVEFGGIPAVVPRNLIDELQQLMEKIKKEGGLAKREFSSGDKVRITEGPLAGYEAIFDLHLEGKDRVQVLLAFLSQSPQPVQLNLADIKKIKK
ncbi:MAG: transcription termination/antitermination protein NusG [Candidatus Promineifilaceae bacterium]|jgi:transcription elongation factor/antiterminator RfaH